MLFSIGALVASVLWRNEQHARLTQMPLVGLAGTLFYFPSPLEFEVLSRPNKEGALLLSWPATVDQTPEFYENMRRQNRYEMLAGADLEQWRLFRKWAVWHFSGNFKALADSMMGTARLPASFDQGLSTGFGASAVPCGLLLQEKAFRLAFLNETFRLPALNYIKKCRGTSAGLSDAYTAWLSDYLDASPKQWSYKKVARANGLSWPNDYQEYLRLQLTGPKEL